MQLLDTVKHHILQLDEKTFFAYIGGFFLGILLLLGGLFYYYSTATDELINELQELNTKRTEMRKLFETYAYVKKQETTVDKILKENETFRIRTQVEEIIKKIKPNSVGENIEGPNSEPKGKYLELTVITTISMVDIKQICELLEEIGKNPRLYTKELDITRSPTALKLDVRLAIGTLELNTTPGT